MNVRCGPVNLRVFRPCPRGIGGARWCIHRAAFIWRSGFMAIVRPTELASPTPLPVAHLTLVPETPRADPGAWPTPVAKVTVVIPTLNEERNVAWVLNRLPPMVDEVILVDGRSTDRTVAVALAIRP